MEPDKALFSVQSIVAKQVLLAVRSPKSYVFQAGQPVVPTGHYLAFFIFLFPLFLEKEASKWVLNEMHEVLPSLNCWW